MNDDLPEKLYPPPVADADSDEALLEAALAGVKPLDSRSRRVGRVNGTPVNGNAPAGVDTVADPLEGDWEFDWTLHPGHHQGGAQEKNFRLMRRLHQGRFSVQGQIDLHRLTRDRALSALEAFLEQSRARGWRCVRIIHGKGNNSEGRVPVLKNLVPKWLSMRRLARTVVAFSSAPPRDGGVGATYVLLRRRQEP